MNKVQMLLKNHRRRLIFGIIIFVLGAAGIRIIFLFLPYLNIQPVTTGQLDKLKLDGYNKLMIVAHPDDELLWGGAHLIEDDYLVVCITNGNNKVRRKEFRKVMADTGDKGLILSYPDKIGSSKANWKYWEKSILKDLDTILGYKEWELVVTHNEKGEYGHIHHIKTHNLVDKAYDTIKCSAKRFYFGDYYVVDRLPDELQAVNSDIYKIKRVVARRYKSQLKTIRKFYHMMPYELWKER